VFCLGRLDLDKGQDVLLTAFDTVRRTLPRARLLIGGDGPHRTELLRLRASLGLDACVEFLGEVPAEKLAAYFACCDVFALTSRCTERWEGFGLVYLEAGYYGKPVVGGNEGGVPEAIAQGESGLLADPRDSLAVAATIAALLADRQLAATLGANGRKRVIDYFNARRMAAETLAHIEAEATAAGSAAAPTAARLSVWRAVYALGAAAYAVSCVLSWTNRRQRQQCQHP
jgi:phosphatidylinositol alpha-1,6-mannosyltransferase